MLRSMRWVTCAAVVGGVMLLAGTPAAPVVRADDSTTQPAEKGNITVTVLTSDNQPAQGVRVMLMPGKEKHASAETSGEHARPRPLQRTVTDSDGKATLPDVADGEYVVRAGTRKVGVGHAKVTVSGSDTAQVSITLEAAKPREEKPSTQPAT